MYMLGYIHPIVTLLHWPGMLELESFVTKLGFLWRECLLASCEILDFCLWLSQQKSFSVDISLDELKHALGCADKYTQFSGFREKVLESIQEEFNDSPEIDIEFLYEPLKTGNKVTHLNIIFLKKGGQKISKSSTTSLDKEPVKLEDQISTEDALLLLPEELRPER